MVANSSDIKAIDSDDCSSDDNNAIDCSQIEVESNSPLHCTFAITGRHEMFQAIYLCKTCSAMSDNDNDNGKSFMCCCEGCAERCHKDHPGLEFVGMGLAYCDCNQLHINGCCNIIDQSIALGAKLGLIQNSSNSTQLLSHNNIVDSNVANGSCNETTTTTTPYPYIRDTFIIEALYDDPELCIRLQNQAQALVEHSKETFWVDVTDNNDTSSSLCDLEILAQSIVQKHIKSYNNLFEHNNGNVSSIGDNITNHPVVGGEWWVQVKSVTHPSLDETSSLSLLSDYANGQEAVDLHYDKDEVLAESFGLGWFPTISTVTYLSESITASPTVIFNIRYDESSAGPEDAKSISEMMISYPERGKHLVFDGHLLHGVPSHYALRRYNNDTSKEGKMKCQQKEVETTEVCELRITFLVNLWHNHKPAGVEVLPQTIRTAIQESTKNSYNKHTFLQLNNMILQNYPINHVTINCQDDLPQQLQGYINLPFVGGKDTTWTDNNNDSDSDDDALIIRTYPPPPSDASTVLVHFTNPNVEAYLDYSSNQNTIAATNDEDDDDDEKEDVD